MPTRKAKTNFEFSAGGIVQDADKLLMVKVQNVEGQKIWTFPKGHIEEGETAEAAAIREVEEETGYRCEIVGPFDKIQYWFKHGRKLTKKTVTWFSMKALEKTGEHDPEEILEAKWLTMMQAETVARYPSDKKILAKLKV